MDDTADYVALMQMCLWHIQNAIAGSKMKYLALFQRRHRFPQSIWDNPLYLSVVKNKASVPRHSNITEMNRYTPHFLLLSIPLSLWGRELSSCILWTHTINIMWLNKLRVYLHYTVASIWCPFNSHGSVLRDSGICSLVKYLAFSSLTLSLSLCTRVLKNRISATSPNFKPQHVLGWSHTG